MITRLRIWWWKWRFIESVLNSINNRAEADIGRAEYLAEEGWKLALAWHDGDVAGALTESPDESAEECLRP